MNVQGRGVHLGHSASFTFAVLEDQAKFINLQELCMSGNGRCQLQARSSTSTAPLSEPHCRKETTAAAAEGHGRTTTGRCEPSHPAKRRHLILPKGRGELLRCWKFGIHLKRESLFFHKATCSQFFKWVNGKEWGFQN